MGITGTEVTKEAADMILTDDNFATIVSAVEGGRGIYDNLMKYVRVQLIMLGGFILLFVLAGAFSVADGAPLTPLQVLWINFAIDVLLAIGLGFDAAAPGLMRRRPRMRRRRSSTALAIRLGVASRMASLALGVVAWGEERYDLAIATTMGLTALSLLHIVAALEVREPEWTIFARYTVANRRFVQLIGATGAHLPRHRARAAPADLRHRRADEHAVGHLPPRADPLPRARGAAKAADRRSGHGRPAPAADAG